MSDFDKLHIMGKEPWQPLSRFIACPIWGDEAERIIVIDPESFAVCRQCGDTRQVRDLVISDNYDYIDVRCADECYSGRGENFDPREARNE
jgi:hypothetical protein